MDGRASEKVGISIPPVTPELLAGLERRFRGMSKDVVANHMRWAARFRAENELLVEASEAVAAAKANKDKARRRSLTVDEIATELNDSMTGEELARFLADCGYVRMEREAC